MSRHYKGATAVITGGATGIGFALAEALAAEGAKVVIASTNDERIRKAVGAIESKGGVAAGISCDVSRRDDVARLLTNTLDRFGSVDLLCANAGVVTGGPLLDHQPNDWNWVYDVTLRGITHCIELFYPYMAKRRRGQIMVTGSLLGIVPDWCVGSGPYPSAKAAAMAIGMALRAEAAACNVEVSVMIPGPVRTEMLMSSRSRTEAYGGPVNAPMPLPTPRSGGPQPDASMPLLLSPEEVAKITIEGLRVNAPVIATHKSMRPVVKDYFDRLLSAWDAA